MVQRGDVVTIDFPWQAQREFERQTSTNAN